MKEDYTLTAEGQYAYRYPRAAVTADTAVLYRDEDGWHILLIRRGNEPYAGSWALPGGFLNMDETTEECARRELQEETGVEAGVLHLTGIYSAIERDPRGRVVTASYYTIVPHKVTAKGADDAAEARWWPLEALPALAFDHAQMICDLRDALRKEGL